MAPFGITDRVEIIIMDTEQWTVSLNGWQPKLYRGWPRTIEAAEELSRQHAADIWIEDGHSPHRLFRKATTN